MRIFISLLAGLCLLFAAAGVFVSYDFSATGPLEAEKTMVIPRGTGFRETAELLAQQEVIRSSLIFDAMAVVTGKARAFKAGEYLFPAGISANQAMDKIVAGDVVVHKITLPEGLRTSEILELLNQEKLLEGNVAAVVPEGALLPETYYFLLGENREALVRRMQSDKNKLMGELWPNRKKDLPFATPEQALVLASIVEKETGGTDERARVAAVFVNRLKKGMKLQSDPTTIYAIEREKGLMARDLLSADLAYNSPYNTYFSAGLPPGPICNPGRAAIEAVLNPMETDELYFVATGTGGHNFAATLKEHNENVKKYKLALRLQKQSQP